MYDKVFRTYDKALCVMKNLEAQQKGEKYLRRSASFTDSKEKLSMKFITSRFHFGSILTSACTQNFQRSVRAIARIKLVVYTVYNVGINETVSSDVLKATVDIRPAVKGILVSW